MFSILSELLNIEDVLNNSMRFVIEQTNFKRVCQGKTKDWDFILKEDQLPLNDLLLIGYDKDLDKNLFEWAATHEQKEKADDFTVYALSLAEVIRKLSPNLYPVQVPSSTLTFPCVNPQTELIELPFEKKTVSLFSSVDHELIIPTELASIAYIPSDQDLSGAIASQLDDLFEEFKEDAPENLNFKGIVTLPFALFTGGNLKGSKYISTTECLAVALIAQQDFVSANKTDASMREKINHASEFINKYLPFI